VYSAKTAKSTHDGPVQTCNMDSMGLSHSDLISLKEQDIFKDAYSTREISTPQNQRLDRKHSYLKNIIKQTNKLQKTLNKSQQDFIRPAQLSEQPVW
jgi:spore coat protein CotF